jgi:hypothetical protein
MTTGCYPLCLPCGCHATPPVATVNREVAAAVHNPSLSELRRDSDASVGSHAAATADREGAAAAAGAGAATPTTAATAAAAGYDATAAEKVQQAHMERLWRDAAGGRARFDSRAAQTRQLSLLRAALLGLMRQGLPQLVPRALREHMLGRMTALSEGAAEQEKQEQQVREQRCPLATESLYRGCVSFEVIGGSGPGALCDHARCCWPNRASPGN